MSENPIAPHPTFIICTYTGACVNLVLLTYLHMIDHIALCEDETYISGRCSSQLHYIIVLTEMNLIFHNEDGEKITSAHWHKDRVIL